MRRVQANLVDAEADWNHKVMSDDADGCVRPDDEWDLNYSAPWFVGGRVGDDFETTTKFLNKSVSLRETQQREIKWKLTKTDLSVTLSCCAMR